MNLTDITIYIYIYIPFSCNILIPRSIPFSCNTDHFQMTNLVVPENDVATGSDYVNCYKLWECV
jgi:hypothetical protein